MAGAGGDGVAPGEATGRHGLPARPFDRYRAIGLARNPFATPDPDPDPGGGEDEGDGSDGIVAGGPLAADLLVDRGVPAPAPTPATLVQLIGVRGAGKTTLLRHWQGLEPGPFHYVPPRPLPLRRVDPPVAPRVYADEVDRLAPLVRLRWFRRLARQRSSAVIGTHRDLARTATLAGLTVTTHHLGPLDRKTLSAIVARRLAAVRVDGPASPSSPLAPLTGADLDDVLAAAGSSVRAAEDLCHLLVAARAAAATPGA